MDKLLNQIEWGLFFWQMLIFIGLILLLKKYAWKPILDAVNSREEGIRTALLSAESARNEMRNLQSQNEQLLASARAERDAMIKEAREMRERMISDSKADAQAEGARMIEQAKLAIQAEKNSAMAELKSHVSILSLEIAEKILRDELQDKEAQSRLVSRMIDDSKLN
ncbi:MAG TPA: F0F1 ATP synthase subunit B [Flavobacterium sp.]|jgi:F-type H+-transporting ATPase subunit b